MNLDVQFTGFTSAAFGGLVDGEFLVFAPDELDAKAMIDGLQATSLPENDVVMLGAFPHDVATLVTRLAGLIVQQKEQSARLIDAMFSSAATVSPAAAQQALRNAQARQELFEEFGALDSEQVARLAGSTAKNRSATASRWVASGQLFAIEHRGSRYYPAFQFDDNGRPRPAIMRVLEALRPFGLDGWEIALWFTTATGWLDDRRPVDLLDADADGVVAAAGHTVDSVAG